MKNRQAAVRVLSVARKRCLSSIEKQKNFRAEKARKALMTLRLTQCHQNWLTIMGHPANFEDRSLWKYNALSLKNHNLIAVPSGSTENRYGVEPLTDSSCPYFSRVKSRISYVDRGHPKDCVNLQCGVELTNIFAATPTIN